MNFQRHTIIGRLLALAVDVGHNLSEILTEAKTLTPFGADYRYPGDYPDVTLEDARRILAVASQARDEIRNRLPNEALD